MRNILLAVSAMILLTPAGNTQQGSFWEQEIPEGLQDEIGNVWLPAPTPPGALDWSTLTEIEVEEKLIDNFLQYVPSFTPVVQSLDGKTVKLNGYMVPLESSERQSHFVLMAYPHSCPFHMPGGPAAYVEVKADFPVKFTYDPVLIEGHFQVLEDYSNGVFYRINAAREVSSTE